MLAGGGERKKRKGGVYAPFGRKLKQRESSIQLCLLFLFVVFSFLWLEARLRSRRLRRRWPLTVSELSSLVAADFGCASYRSR